VVRRGTQRQGEDKDDERVRVKKQVGDGIIPQEEYDKEKRKILDGE